MLFKLSRRWKFGRSCLVLLQKKMQNELYRLTFCENVLKIALGTQPQRPQLGSEGFPGSL